MTTETMQHTIYVGPDLTALLERLTSLAESGGRHIVGIVGAPGAGKSTLANELAAALGAERAVVLPLDGFHIASAALASPEQLKRRGAMDTFDVSGYLSLLGRLVKRQESTTYAPGFERDIEEPVAGLIPIAREVPIVITEGNYLLSSEPGWREVRDFLDEVWFLETGPAQRLQRLIARHVRYGKSDRDAKTMAEGSDENNARQIALTRSAADLVIRVI